MGRIDDVGGTVLPKEKAWTTATGRRNDAADVSAGELVQPVGEGVEDAIYDSYAFRRSMGVDYLGDEQVPDATMLCKFRKTLNEKEITKLLFDTTKAFLEWHGKVMHGGTIVDATIIGGADIDEERGEATRSRNAPGKKGNERHFGERLHIGVDAGTGYIHSMEVTPANTSERDTVPLLIRPDDEVVYGDAGYSGLAKRAEIQADSHLAQIYFRTNTRNRLHWKTQAPGFDWDRYMECQKSRVRSKVENVFLILKRLFGYCKVRYRGLEKNRTHAFILVTCANLFMLAQSGWHMDNGVA